jgi:hypothetical protein
VPVGKETNALSIYDSDAWHALPLTGSDERLLAEEVPHSLRLDGAVAVIVQTPFQSLDLQLLAFAQTLDIEFANLLVLGMPAGEGRVDVFGRQIAQVGDERVHERPCDADIAERVLARFQRYYVLKLKQVAIDGLIEPGPMLPAVIE